MASEREPTAAGADTSAPAETTNAAGEQNAPAADAASNDASSDDHVRDEKVAPGPTKWQKVKSHFWRYKWWYLLAIAILLAILLPLLFTVIIPAIVQDILNDQKLPIYGGALQVISPTEVNMSIETQLKTPIAATLKPVDLFLYSKETKPVSSFFKLQFPETHIKSHTNVTITNQTLLVTNETELTKWFNVFFDKPDAELSLEGKPEIRLGSLKYHRSLKKTVDIASLNYLDGFALKSLDFDLNANRTSKNNMKGMLNIPNSGVLRLGLGNLTFNVMSGDIRLGLINLWDLQLWPGNNSVPFDGNFYFDQLVPNLSEILDMQKGPLGNGYLEFNATGNTTIAGGEHIKYIEGVLNYKHIRFTFPVITLLGDVLGGLLDANQGSLLDIFGTSIGNSTLLEHVLGHWDNNGEGGSSNKTARSLMERSKTRAPKAWMWSLLKLGLTRRSL
ncbi:hypothetical protein FOCG_08026 [Fusarium oxysporum f. sp. radicis-lycopersici 26381]|uniref:Uncharacterized protein n=4 Tax=Fusarium oxysporum TaxID=5507 RepID=A0A2H3G1T8_FUSOX|nr:hypothetical protein FOXG_13419 [Fusarium oxysporum f. sp. lycopersici 4287]EWZ30881.1 hypothetical protein FOZG_15317 [Fusarium oxysporum Fo47]EWZ84920.1 hypothetical protein FOWG_11426 [Fusarium oxysporum f. sp. lycopersici MN25]EXL52205.1 hypothetical protein FOCG_08026 [Fusarium oxysporum f. sp. radicis-lycopersici 26381]KAJ4123552.1 hypothetical protein NW765_006576 [Fusarium oxysporum]PCD24957.1 hypothetical protein AU210_014071 [Fusarium oxysporum f. sp. radicis-cucumerinum]RKK09034